MEPYGAIMLVFQNKIPEDKQGTAERNYPDYETMQNIEGDWQVDFDPEWGGPGSVTFLELMDWSEHPDEVQFEPV